MKTLFLFFLALLMNSAFAQQRIVSFDYTPAKQVDSPQRIVNDMGVNGLTVDYKFKSAFVFHKEEKSLPRNQNKFQLLSIPGFSHLQEPGLPALPSHIDIVAVPKGASYKLKITYQKSRQHKGFRIYPARKPATDTYGDPEPPFVIDKDFYKKNTSFPQSPVRIVETVELRGMKFLLIETVPVQYNPATSEIYTFSELKYKLIFSGASEFLDYENHSKTAVDILSDYPLNSRGIKNDYLKFLNAGKGNININGNKSINYIIVTQNSMLAAADTLATWKRQMGYGVEVVSAQSWTSSAVKNAIHTRYQNYSPKPDYFVIIGDVQQVPAELFTSPDGSGTYGTDLYYACMGGGNDYVPEMAHGRISVSTATEAMTVIHKIVNYERKPVSDSSFYQNALNCAMFQDDNIDGYADRRFTHTSEEVRDYVMGRGYNVQRVYKAKFNVYPYNYNNGYYSNAQFIPNELRKSNGFAWNGNGNDIKNAINAGRFYVLHRDHGYAGGGGWASPYYVKSSIDQLSNGNKLPVVFSINCHTGEFTLPNCFAEKFLRKANGGAVGVVAAAYYSYSGYNDGFTVGMFDAIWSNPGIIPAFGSGGNASPQVTSHNDIPNMGFVVNHGLMRMVQTWGGNNNNRRYTYRLFHYFGDPAMRIWTDVPDSISASFSNSVSCTDSVFYVSGCSDSNAVATLMAEGLLLGSTQLVNGAGYIPISFIPGNDITLTISGRNKIPLITHISVDPGGIPAMYPMVTDNICHGDSAGKIRVLIGCGYPPYQYSWSTGQTTKSIDNLPAGSYVFTVTDTVNNTVTDTFDVWEPATPLQSQPIVTDAKCYFESSGSIQLNLSGGVPPYTYHWSNGSSSSQANTLPAGNYTVSAQDSLGCAFSQSFTINQPPAINLSTSYTDDTLNNCTGTGTVNVSGGIPPYTYSWNDPNMQTTPTATGLCKGIYKVTVKDSNLCTHYRTIFINNTVGIENQHVNNIVKVYPNPASQRIYIRMEKATKGQMLITIRNNTGKKTAGYVFPSQGGKVNISLDISALSAGIYFMTIDDNSGRIYSGELLIR